MLFAALFALVTLPVAWHCSREEFTGGDSPWVRRVRVVLSVALIAVVASGAVAWVIAMVALMEWLDR